jgi:hypothetical protein
MLANVLITLPQTKMMRKWPHAPIPEKNLITQKVIQSGENAVAVVISARTNMFKVNVFLLPILFKFCLTYVVITI